MDRAAVVEMIERRRGSLLRLLQSRLPATIAPEDVFQDAALRAVQHVGELRESGKLDAWVRQIFVRAAADAVRAPGRREVPTESPGAGEASPPAPEICACSLTLLGTLPPPYADVLRRIDVEGQGTAEVAAELGTTANNVLVRTHRARRALRQQLQEHCGVSSARECLSCACVERGCCAS